MQPGQEDPQKTPPGYSEPVDPYESAEFDPTGDSPYHPPFPARPGPATPPEQQQSGPPAPPSYPASYPPQTTPPPYSQQGTPPPYSPQGTPSYPPPSYPTPPAPDPQPYPGSGGPAYPQQQTSGGPVYPPPQPYGAPQPQYPAPQPYAPQQQQQPFGPAQPYPMQQQGYPTPPPYGYEPGRPVGPQNTVGLVSMILGICSAALFCCTWIGLPLSAAAVVTGIIGLNKAKAGVATNRGQALTGLIVGSVATAWFILALILGAVNILSPQTFS